MQPLTRISLRSPYWSQIYVPFASFSPTSTLRLPPKRLYVSSRIKNTYPFPVNFSVRNYQNLAPEPSKAATSTKQPTPQLGPKVPRGDPENPTQSEQRKKDWRIIWKLMENVWPKNDWSTRGRVLFGLTLLVGGKVRVLHWSKCWRLKQACQLLNVQVPQVFKSVIDALNVDFAAGSTVWIVAGSLILGCAWSVVYP